MGSNPSVMTRAGGRASGRSADGASDVLHQVGLFPGEAAVLVRGAAEMAVGRRAPVDRTVKLERAADVRGGEPEDFGQRPFEFLLVDFAGAMGIDQERHRVGDTDRIGDLDGAALRDAGGDHVLGKIAGGIGRRAIDLGGILSGEGAAAMGSIAAIGVDDDLAPSEPAIPSGAPDYEIAGWTD